MSDVIDVLHEVVTNEFTALLILALLIPQLLRVGARQVALGWFDGAMLERIAFRRGYEIGRDETKAELGKQDGFGYGYDQGFKDGIAAGDDPYAIEESGR